MCGTNKKLQAEMGWLKNDRENAEENARRDLEDKN
jgi:hypothetical protein